MQENKQKITKICLPFSKCRKTNECIKSPGLFFFFFFFFFFPRLYTEKKKKRKVKFCLDAGSDGATSYWLFWGECVHYWTSCNMFKGDRTCWRSTAVWASTRDLATSGQSILFPHLRNRHLTATETALIIVSTHHYHVHLGILRNRLGEASIRVRRPYVGPPLIQAHPLRCVAWLTAHTQIRFSIWQWGRVLLLTRPVSPFFPRWSTSHQPTGQGKLRRCLRCWNEKTLELFCYGLGDISHGVKSQLIVISGNVTAVRYRNEVLRPVSVLLCSNANWFYSMIMPRPT